MKRFTSFGAMVLIALSVHSERASALGDFGSVVHGFWSVVISSYWWGSQEEIRALYDIRSYDEQAASVLAGETEPVGLAKPSFTIEPPNSSSVTCNDFRVVRISQIPPDDSRSLPFRVHYPKSALYFSIGGWLAGLGLPTHADFWIAAMLPEDALPLFISETEVNPAVLSRPLIAEMGWSEGLAGMPAGSLSLQSEIPCNEFTIYHVRFER